MHKRKSSQENPSFCYAVSCTGPSPCCCLPVALKQGLSIVRCNGDLAQMGDNKTAGVLKCGEPVAKDSFCRPAEGACLRVEEWTYNPGTGQFLTMLRFENGVLVSIR